MADTTPGAPIGWHARIADWATDLAGLGGAGSIVYGIDIIYPPAAFIVGGAFALAAAWLSARKSTD